jgi:hypothetical protein
MPTAFLHQLRELQSEAERSQWSRHFFLTLSDGAQAVAEVLLFHANPANTQDIGNLAKLNTSLSIHNKISALCH